MQKGLGGGAGQLLPGRAGVAGTQEPTDTGLYLRPVAVAQGLCGTAVTDRAASDSQGWEPQKADLGLYSGSSGSTEGGQRQRLATGQPMQ